MACRPAPTRTAEKRSERAGGAMTVQAILRVRNIALGVIVAVLATWFFVSTHSAHRQHFSAVFADASDVVPRNDVRINDVIVGKVTSVSLRGLHARVSFSLAPDIRLPAATRAELRQVSLLGEEFVALVPSGSGRLAPGATIPIDRTRRATDFEDLVAAGGELTANLSSAQLNQLVGGLTNAFGGDPAKLGQLIDATAAVSKTFNDSTPQLEATIDRVQQMAADMAPHGPALGASIDHLAAGAAALDANRKSLAGFTSGLSQFSQRMADLLTGNEARLTAGLPQLKQVLGEVQGSLGDLQTWIQHFYGLNAAWACIGDGSFINESFLLLPEAAHIDYGTGHCNPELGNRSSNKQGQPAVTGVPSPRFQTVDGAGIGNGSGTGTGSDTTAPSAADGYQGAVAQGGSGGPGSAGAGSAAGSSGGDGLAGMFRSISGSGQ